MSRPRNRASAKKAGTAWETEIVNYLTTQGWPHAERRRLAGQADRGDIAGVPGVAIEAKNTRALDLARAVDEATVEAGNAGVGVGVAWIKRRGKPSAADGYVVMAGETFVALLAEAGYR